MRALRSVLDAAVVFIFCACLALMGTPRAGAAPAPEASPGASAPADTQPAAVQSEFLKDYTRGPKWFPSFLEPYKEQPVPPPLMENSPRLRDLIRDGKLEISVADALALAIENNLDISVQRYIIPFAQTDILRSQSGQADRGVTGAVIPGGLSSGALGAGVSTSSSTGGTGSAGGITGGGGAVNIGPAGAFDPTATFSTSWDRVTTPLNSLVVSGVPTTTSYATSYSGSYAQMFWSGASYSVSLSGLRQSTNQGNTLFSPSVTSRLSLGFNQPLLNGFGRLPNQRFILVARNDLRIAQEAFRLQVVTTVVQVEDAYWGLAAFQQNVRVAQQSLAASEQLLDETQKQAKVGTMAALDVVTAESQVASSQRDLIVAQTQLQLQENTLKTLLSKQSDPALDAATIVISDQLPEPRDADVPALTDALTTALANRPELREAQGNLQNQNIAIRFTQNNLLPNAAVFGLYAGSGLIGNSTSSVQALTAAQLLSLQQTYGQTFPSTAGAGTSLGQAFGADFPEYAGGLNAGIPIRNRSAQADSVRSQLEGNQLQLGFQKSTNQVALEVRQAVLGLNQGKSQVAAAHEAVQLAQRTLDAEQKKLAAGVSTSYNVILRERDLVSAQYAEVQAVGSYASALVEMDRAMGATLDRNGIQFGDALAGTVSNMPTPPFSVRGFNPGQAGGASQGAPQGASGGAAQGAGR